jgi:signal transduction histidine kinase
MGRGEGRNYAVEYRWQCADGQYKHFLDQAVVLRDPDGSPVEYAGTLLDVTDRKELELQLLQVGKMDAIGKLTGGIAHDFNNLLAAVLGGIGMIERRVPLNDEQGKIVGMTRKAAEQGAELVARLLSFARKQRLDPAAIDVAKLAGSVNDLLAHTLGGLVELRWDTPPDVWKLYADEGQLELALMNLIINARDAMPDGGTVSVTARNITVAEKEERGVAPGDYVLLAVADTGSGIAPELLERVMEPFFTTKPMGKGTGLGLSMVYGFAQQSGGAMRIESRLGEGTHIRMWLPRAPQEAVPAVLPAVPAEQEVDIGRSLSVLLVDDHEGVRATTAALIADLGHQITMAGEGRSALEKIEALEKIDLLITDYAMPHISGVEVVRRAREICPKLPAIIITGNADVGEIRTERNVLTLTKPFTSDQMRAAIKSVITGI